MKPLNYNHTVTNADGTHTRLCDVSGGGSSGGSSGGLELDVIWTNPTPSNAVGQLSVDLTGIENYRYIVIKYFSDTSSYSTLTGVYMSSLIDVNDLNGSNYPVGCIWSCRDEKIATRSILGTGSPSQIRFVNAYNGTSQDNTKNIPYIIYGVK